jgi:hypothetical protein
MIYVTWVEVALAGGFIVLVLSLLMPPGGHRLLVFLGALAVVVALFALYGHEILGDWL